MSDSTNPRISLKRAAAYAKEALAAASAIRLSPDVTWSIHYEGAPNLDQLRPAQQQLTASIALGRRLIEAAYAIRAQLAQANHASGIDTLLTERACLLSLTAYLQKTQAALEGAKGETNLHLVQPKLAALRAGKGADAYGYVPDSVSINTVSAEDTSSTQHGLRTAKRRLGEIAEELGHANLKGYICLTPNDLSALRDGGIID